MILITGATGRVGGAASAALSREGTAHRVLVRDPGKFTAADGAAVEVVRGAMENPDELREALRGTTGALLVMGNHPSQPTLEKQFASLAAEAGVKHLVKVSSMEAGPESVAAFPKQHFETEEHIRSLDVDWTFLQPNFFMQNLLMYAGSITGAGVFALPLGMARTAPVDTRDVGAVAAAVLSSDQWRNQALRLTGPELMHFEQVADVMSTVLGKPIKYVAQSPEAFREVLSGFVHEPWQLNGVCELFAEIANGSLDERTDTVKQVLGRDPISLARFAADHTTVFT
ncbi:MAG: SDR family oxidoreductase [Pseudomonadota bacterium]